MDLTAVGPGYADRTVLIAAGTTAMRAHGKSGLVEVTVLGYRYTTQWLFYGLAPRRVAGPAHDDNGRAVPAASM